MLVVRLFPRKHADWTVQVEVEYEAEEVVTLTFPREADQGLDADGSVDLPFVFLWGSIDDDAADVSFSGLSIVDVSEATALGHAPEVEISALRRPAQRLPVEADAGVLWVEVLAGWAPPGVNRYRRSILMIDHSKNGHEQVMSLDRPPMSLVHRGVHTRGAKIDNTTSCRISAGADR